MKKTEEQKFLEVKEHLDYYRLPTSFPYEATDLLAKLLALIPRESNKENIPSKGNSSSPHLPDALKLEISKTIKENNRLHQ